MKRTRISISILPHEMYVEIFEFVPRNDLLDLRVVCKEFCDAFNICCHTQPYVVFFKFLSHRGTLRKKKKKSDRIETSQGKNFQRNYSSFDELIRIVKHTKMTLQAQELLEGELWKWEKKHFLKTATSIDSEYEKTIEDIGRKDIPLKERLVLTSKEKEREFKRLCQSLKIKTFEKKSESRDEYYCGKYLTIIYEFPNDVFLHTYANYNNDGYYFEISGEILVGNTTIFHMEDLMELVPSFLKGFFYCPEGYEDEYPLDKILSKEVTVLESVFKKLFPKNDEKVKGLRQKLGLKRLGDNDLKYILLCLARIFFYDMDFFGEI